MCRVILTRTGTSSTISLIIPVSPFAERRPARRKFGVIAAHSAVATKRYVATALRRCIYFEMIWRTYVKKCAANLQLERSSSSFSFID